MSAVNPASLSGVFTISRLTWSGAGREHGMPVVRTRPTLRLHDPCKHGGERGIEVSPGGRFCRKLFMSEHICDGLRRLQIDARH